MTATKRPKSPKPRNISIKENNMKRHEINIEKAIAGAFCDFIREVPVNETFTLYNVQGVLRGFKPVIPDEQDYEELLQGAIMNRWIEPVEGEPDTYQRVGWKFLKDCLIGDIERACVSRA